MNYDTHATLKEILLSDLEEHYYARHGDLEIVHDEVQLCYGNNRPWSLLDGGNTINSFRSREEAVACLVMVLNSP